MNEIDHIELLWEIHKMMYPNSWEEQEFYPEKIKNICINLINFIDDEY